MNLSVDLVKQISDESDEEVDQSFCSEILNHSLSYFPNFASIEEVSCCIVHSDNDAISALNEEFRNKAKPTNVLSFPLHEFSWKNIKNYSHQEKELELGDIVLSIEKVKEEAKEQEKSFKDHYSHLLVHSFLHLLGYDHEEDSDAEAMESLEQQILYDLNNKRI